MKNLVLLTVTMFSIISFQSCTRHWVPLTENTIKDYHLDSAILKGAQFAISDAVKMQKGKVSGQTSLGKRGKVIVGITGKVEEVFIPKMQRGMCVSIPKPGVLRMCFEKKYHSKNLNFSVPANDTLYRLLPNDGMWNTNHEAIYYGDTTNQFLYKTTSDMIVQPYLFIDLTKSRNVDARSHIAKGHRAK